MSPSPAVSLSRRARLFLVFIFGSLVVLIAVLLVVEPPSFVNTAQDARRAHAAASAGITVAIGSSYLALRSQRMDLLALLAMGTVGTVLFELLQLLAPSRSLQLDDVSAGLLGVLGAGTALDALVRVLEVRRATYLLGAIGIGASIVMGGLITGVLAPATAQTVSPDGVSCPETSLDGSGQRFTIGPALEINDGCLNTEVGGWGLLGPATTALRTDNVLVSSPLDELRATTISTGELEVRVQIQPGERRHGTVLAVSVGANRRALIVRTRGTELAVHGPGRGTPEVRTIVFVDALTIGSTHIVEVHLQTETLEISVDGVPTASVAIDPGWIDDLAGQDVRIYVGNGPLRQLPFSGTIDWIEIGRPS